MPSEPTTSPASESNQVLEDKIRELSDLYDSACLERHLMGEHKYGHNTFLKVNTLQEAAYELLDLGNYARYGFIRLMLLDEALQEIVAGIPDENEGKFVPVGSEWKKQ